MLKFSFNDIVKALQGAKDEKVGSELESQEKLINIRATLAGAQTLT